MKSLFSCSFCERRASPPSLVPSAPSASPSASSKKRVVKDGEWQEHRRKGNEFFKKQEYDEAAKAYSAAIELAPGEAALWVNRSIAHRQRNNWQDAANDAKQAVELQFTNEKAHYGYALALQRLGELPEAMRACEAGLGQQPENKPLLDLRASLRATSNDRKQVGVSVVGPESAKPSAKPKAVPEPKKKVYSTDYSRFKDIASDSDDDAAAGEAEAENATEQSQEQLDVPEEKRFCGHMTSEERTYVIDQMMQMMRKAREKTISEVKTEGGAKGIDLEGKFDGAPKMETKNIPEEYRKHIGVISVENLGKFTCSRPRMLVSVYGDIFDVSNRTDQYGSGNKSMYSGRDVTWELIMGDDSNKHFNRFYDIFKQEKAILERMLRVICHWLICFEENHGKPIGRLEKFNHETDLPAPPIGDYKEPCKQQ